MTVDESLMTINRAICRHLDNPGNFSRGVISQEILAQLRHFVEHIMMKFYCISLGYNIDDSWENIKKALEYVQPISKLKVLTRFHDLL